MKANYKFLHEESHCGDDSTRVIGVMKLVLFGVNDCCVDDDPPTGEKLHKPQAQTHRSDGNYKQEELHLATLVTTEAKPPGFAVT